MKTEDLESMYITQILKGDDTGFKYFINTYKDMAYTLAMSIVKNDSVAQEVVQDAFFRAYRGLPSFKGNAIFRTWFYKITVNEGLKRYKKMKKEIISFHENYDQTISDDNILFRAEEPDQIEKIKRALLVLPPKESLVLRLYYLEEQDIKMVCHITGMSSSNVKVIMFRARKNLSKLMNDIKDTNG
jgi:RNA polymerase sigma factor (sigma-70 family)